MLPTWGARTQATCNAGYSDEHRVDKVLIEAVAEGGGAAKAGMMPGDTITKIGDTEIPDARALASCTQFQKGGRHSRSHCAARH